MWIYLLRAIRYLPWQLRRKRDKEIIETPGDNSHIVYAQEYGDNDTRDTNPHESGVDFLETTNSTALKPLTEGELDIEQWETFYDHHNEVRNQEGT